MRRARRLRPVLLLIAASCAKGEDEWLRDLAAPEPFARVLAVTALAQQGRTETLPQLLAMLDDPNDEVRAATGAALVRLGAPVVPPLIEALKRDVPTAERDRAWALLPRLEAEAAGPMVDALLDGEHDTDVVLDMLKHMDPATTAALTPRLIATLEAARPDQRRLAADALRILVPDDREALLALMRATHDPHPAVSAAALDAVVAALIRRMRTGDGVARHAAQVQLETLGAAALPALSRALRSAAPEDVADPIAALAAHGPAAIEPAFSDLYQRDPQHVHRASALVAAIGPDALDTLRALMDRSDERLRLLATVSIGALGPAAAPAVPRLLDDLQGPDPLLRWAAAHSLGLIEPDDDDSVARLLAVAEGADRVLRQQLSPAIVPALLERILQRPAEADAWRARLLALGAEMSPELDRISRGKGPRAALARELLTP